MSNQYPVIVIISKKAEEIIEEKDKANNKTEDIDQEKIKEETISDFGFDFMIEAEESQELSVRVKEVTETGVVVLRFSQEVFVFKRWEVINDTDEPAIEFKVWSPIEHDFIKDVIIDFYVTVFNKDSLSIQLIFNDPLEISIFQK